jgi:hypothetical protein
MNKTGKQLLSIDLDHEGANALLAATFEFLRRNKISADSIIDFTQKYHVRHHRGRSLRLYRSLVRTYDDMGVIMATWFSDPRFLNGFGYPRPLSQGRGPLSISHLIRVSGASIKASVALELMRQSPSIRFDEKGTISANRRVFVLPKFEVPRAAFVVERFLDTLQRNVQSRKTRSPLLLERTCYVSQVDLRTIAPIIRDIDSRGTAFMDSIDGDIEDLRLRRAKRKSAGELGVLVFAWTKPRGRINAPKQIEATSTAKRR